MASSSSKPYEIGRMRQVVTWNQKASTTTRPPTPGTNGQPAVTYTPMGTLRAEVVPIAGNQVVNSTQLVPLRSYAIRMRWSPAVVAMAAQDQLIFKGRTLTVTSVRVIDEREWYLEITAEEKASRVTGSP